MSNNNFKKLEKAQKDEINFFKNLENTMNIIPLNIKLSLGNSLAVKWLGLRASTAGGPGSIPGWGN